jgi:hypothetical protein
MDKNSNPLDAIIEFAWSAGADRFWVNNAKDELKKLQEKSREMSLVNPVAWARINSSGDLYDLRLQNNPYNNPDTVIPLYKEI